MVHGLVLGWMLTTASGMVGAEPPACKPPKAGLVFDGHTVYGLPVDALKLDPKALTVSAWVNLNGVVESQVFLNVGRSNTAFTFYLYNHRVRMLIGFRPSAYAYADADPPPAKTWVHYAGSYDGKLIRIYMNGVLVKTLPVDGSVGDLAGPLYIGALDSERFVRGQMEDLRIWRRVLSDEEIKAVAMGESAGGLRQDLAGRWTGAGLAGDTLAGEPSSLPAAARIHPTVIINAKDDGYRGIWYMNQPSEDEYKYKYSGGYGTYCANHIPHAWYVDKVNKTFFVYGGTTHDSHTHLIQMASCYDHNTGMVPRPTILLDKKTSDAHDNPVLNVDDDGYIWVFSSSHGQGRPSYISKSKKPYSVDEFELIWTGNFSYPQPWYFSGHGFVFMHTFYDPDHSMYVMTSPNGVDWSQRRLLSDIGVGHYQVCRPLGKDKIGTSFMYHPKGKGLNWRTNLYYMESKDYGRTFKTVDGKPVELPLKDIINPTLVREYESKGLLVYIQDINCDSQGNPIILYLTSKGYESGPKNAPRTWTTAHWTGADWDINGGDIVSDSNYDDGSIYIENDNLWRIVGPTQDGPQAYNPGGEVAMWESSNQGRNWKMTRQLTTKSAFNHTYVRRPVNAHPDFYAFWADGNAREPSDSHFYFCNKRGDVFQLPAAMTADFEKPIKVLVP